MESFESYIKLWQFSITHARPQPWKKFKEHSKKRLAGVWYKKSKKPLYKKGKIFMFWHHAKEWFIMNKDWDQWEVTSIQIDSWCGRWTWNLTGVQLWEKQVRVIDSWWANMLVNLYYWQIINFLYIDTIFLIAQ